MSHALWSNPRCPSYPSVPFDGVEQCGSSFQLCCTCTNYSNHVTHHEYRLDQSNLHGRNTCMSQQADTISAIIACACWTGSEYYRHEKYTSSLAPHATLQSSCNTELCTKSSNLHWYICLLGNLQSSCMCYCLCRLHWHRMDCTILDIGGEDSIIKHYERQNDGMAPTPGCELFVIISSSCPPPKVINPIVVSPVAAMSYRQNTSSSHITSASGWYWWEPRRIPSSPWQGVSDIY